jgi:hypothetical protein
MDAATTARFLRELRKELSTVYLDGGNTIGTFLNKLEESYGYLSDLCDHKDSSNPIITYVQLHELTDNFATSSEAQKIMYEENIKYQFSRAVTILMALGSNTKHQAKKDKLDAKNAVNPKTGKDGWPDVTEGSRDKNGNPYCYLMEGFVRLATFDEMQTWREQCDNSHSENEIFIYDKSGLKVHAVDFAKRMHGRTLEQELRLAGIQNLDSVKSESRHNGYHVEISNFEYASLQGIMFSMERWGVKRGKRTYENKAWWPVSMGGQGILYNYVRFDRKDIRGMAPSGPGNVSKWFDNKNDYIHVSPEYICWWSTKATDGRPAGIAISQNYHNLFAYLFPMTFLKFA